MSFRYTLWSFGTLALASHAALPQTVSPAPAAPAFRTCDTLPHADHPSTRLSNGALSAVIFLPDAQHGYYRGSRFDWAGVLGCVAYRGHTFFGEWFPRYDPLLNDAVTGPVEEFRAPTSELGYDDASANGRFLKIGVGVLRRIDSSPYSFSAAYPIVDAGQRTTRISKRSATFTQLLKTDFGYGYRYQKTVALSRHGVVLTLTHKLKNLGSRTIDTDVYDHDFFMLDDQPTGPGMVVRLGFPPTPGKPFSSTASISANEIVFNEALTRGRSPQAYLTGYTGRPGEYDIAVEDRNTHIGVEQTSTSPISKFYFWSTPTTICPEAYIHIHVLPGKTQTWEITYRFKAE